MNPRKKNGQATKFAVLIRPGTFIQVPLPPPQSEKFFSFIMNKGDNSKPSDHFDLLRHILGAGRRDFLDSSLTRSKSGRNGFRSLRQCNSSCMIYISLNLVFTQIFVTEIISDLFWSDFSDSTPLALPWSWKN